MRTNTMEQEEMEKKVKWMPEENEETVPIRSYSDQKRKSSIAFKEIFSTTDEQLREKFIDFDGFDSEIDTEEKSIEKIAVNLSKSMEQLSKLKDFDAEDLKSKRLVSSVSIPPLVKKKSSFHSHEPSIQSLLDVTKSLELVKNREPGSTKRSSPNFNAGSLGIFSEKEIHPRVSENIPVRNMTIDNLTSDKLDPKIANFYADIIEQILDKLELIRYTIPIAVIKWDERFKSLEDSYGDIKHEECESTSGNIENNYFSRKLRAEKLQQDRTYIYNVLKQLMEELRTENSYDCLKKEIDDIVRSSENQRNLEVYHEIWNEQLHQLHELIEIEKHNNQLKINTVHADVENISFKIKNLFNNSTLKLNFVEKWEESRLKQKQLLLEMKEQSLNDKLSECIKKEKVDEIISGELITFCQSEIMLIERQIEEWRSKYDIERDDVQQEIDCEKGKIFDIKKLLEERIKLRDEQKMIIDKYEIESAKKIEADEYWMIMNKAATIIQAIWRGIMVRKKLGRFKNLLNAIKKRKKLVIKKKRKKNVRTNKRNL